MTNIKFIRLKTSRGRFTKSDIKTWYFYNFCNRLAIGFGANNKPVKLAHYSGMLATIDDNRILTVKASKEYESISIEFENSNEKLNYTTGHDEKGGLTITADLWDASFKNGFYEISATFTEHGISRKAKLYLLVNCASDSPSDYEFYICFGEEHYYSEEFGTFTTRRKAILELINKSGITPENALTASYRYPCRAGSDNNDEAYWVNKAHEIIKGYENSAASKKALLLHDWMTSNLKYDYYKVNVLGHPRYTNGYTISDTSQFVSRNYTGVCLDFSSIYAIMCREVGVPCVVLSNETHAWNAVYVANDWYEVDLTVDTRRYVYGEDTSIVKGTELYCYDGFCNAMVNDEIPDTATRFCW